MTFLPVKGVKNGNDLLLLFVPLHSSPFLFLTYLEEVEVYSVRVVGHTRREIEGEK